MDDVLIKHAALLAGRRVLVVEDDYMIGDALASVLQDEGAQVLGPIGWAAEALGVVEDRTNLIDLAVLDVDLHGERSYRIADALLDRDIPFLFTTGYNPDGLERAYRDYPRCVKPLSGRTLVAALSRIVEKTAGRPS